MPKLFGRTWDRRTLQSHVGDIRQIGGAQRVVLDDGPERGVRAVEVRTGTGLVFWVLPDRGMDLWRAEYRGAALAWISPTGPIHPAFFEPEGLGWLRGFPGGMLTTCGLTSAGPPCRDEGKDLGLHGRASYLAATDLSILQGWSGDDYGIEISGKIREVSVFGDHLELTRRIRTALGENRLWIEDAVENLGSRPAPHMMLYHVNAGFPVLGPESELLAPAGEAQPRDPEAEKEKERWNRFLPPTPGFAERVYFHRFRGGAQGDVAVALVNRSLGEPGGIGYALRYPLSQLPCFTEWKMMGAGLYAVGTEPGNVFPESRDLLRREGRLPTIQPGQVLRYRLEFEALGGPERIRAVENEIKSL